MSLEPDQPDEQSPDGATSAQTTAQVQVFLDEPASTVPVIEDTPLPDAASSAEAIAYIVPPRRKARSYERPSGYGYVPPQGTPQPLGQALQGLFGQYLKVLTRPGVQSFAEEQSNAGWGIIWLQLLGLGLFGTVIAVLHSFLESALRGFAPGGGIVAVVLALYNLAGSFLSFSSFLSVIAGFFIVVGIQYWLAKVFGGNGYFRQQGYSYLLFFAPLTVLSAVLNLIPVFGFLAVFGIGVYQIVLNVFSIMAAHRLSGGKATIVVMIPITVILILVALLFIALVFLIAHALQGMQ